ncbi:MAG: hypothetical protein K9L78_01695 [Victivallales bacterium]|nr:hypothetical protein [Victivallales bacterium]MCF7888809.1 hypothetical protein [Victivallales bacterium]
MEIFHVDNFLWTPIRTKARREKKLAEYCEANGIKYYLPLTKSIKRYERKTVTFYPPMFSGYIFCQLDTDHYNLLLRSHDVFYKVNIDEAMEKLLIEELKSIQLIENLSSEKEVKIKPELVEGTPVVISQGPLQGTSGIITKRSKDVLITVNIDILGQSASVKLDIGEVETGEEI